MPDEPTPEPTPEPAPVARDVELSWFIPDAREDGSKLEVYEIGGYVIYIADNSTAIEQGQVFDIADAQTTTYTLYSLPQGQYKVAIGSYDNDGLYSQLSDPINITVQ